MICLHGYKIEIGLVQSKFATSSHELIPNNQEPIRLRTELDMHGLADEPAASVNYEMRDYKDCTCVEVVAVATRKIINGGDPANWDITHVHAIPGYFGGCSISRDRAREAVFSPNNAVRAFNALTWNTSRTAPAVYVVYMTANRTYIARAAVDLKSGVSIKIPYTMFDTRNYPKSPRRSVGIGLPPEGKLADDSITQAFDKGSRIFIYHSIEAAIKRISYHAAKYLCDNDGNCHLDQWTNDLDISAKARIKAEEERIRIENRVQKYINMLPKPPYIKEERKARSICVFQIACAVAALALFFVILFFFNHYAH